MDTATGRGFTGRWLSIAACALAFGAAFTATASATVHSYTFDTGNQGWLMAADAETFPVLATHNPSGGNTGGTIFNNDQADEVGCPSAPTCDFAHFYSPDVAPGAYAANFGGVLSFDFQVDHISGPTPGSTILAKIAGPTGTVLRGLPVAQTSAFQPISVSLGGGEWFTSCIPVPPLGCPIADASVMQTVLSKADRIVLDVDVRAGTSEIYKLDNVLITEGPVAAVPTPPGAVPVAGKKCKRKKGKRMAAGAKKKKCKKKKG